MQEAGAGGTGAGGRCRWQELHVVGAARGRSREPKKTYLRFVILPFLILPVLHFVISYSSFGIFGISLFGIWDFVIRNLGISHFSSSFLRFDYR